MMIAEGETRKLYQQINIEENYVIVEEPIEIQLSHASQTKGTGVEIARAIYNAIKDTTLEPKLKIIGSDGKATMTENKTDCIASLEAL